MSEASKPTISPPEPDPKLVSWNGPRNGLQGRKYAARMERKAARAPSREHRACFWTWPWGHIYKRTNLTVISQTWKCVVCGKKKVKR